MISSREEPVKRCAVLIGNDKWGGDFLPGVGYDLDCVKSFLLSPHGGAWSGNEIYDIVQPVSRDSFLRLITSMSEKYDYIFIYFGGHGELSGHGYPLFILPGGEGVTLDELKAILVSKPTLMISDSCQGIPEYKDGGILNESMKMFALTDSVQEFKARRAFDNELRTLPPMFTYASAVSPGQYASEDSDGGLYTQRLLNACHAIIDDFNEASGVIGICYPHSIAALAVRTNSSNKQRPRIEGYNRTFQPPFLVKL